MPAEGALGAAWLAGSSHNHAFLVCHPLPPFPGWATIGTPSRRAMPFGWRPTCRSGMPRWAPARAATYCTRCGGGVAKQQHSVVLVCGWQPGGSLEASVRVRGRPNPCPYPGLVALAGHHGRSTARMSSEHVAPRRAPYLLSHINVHIDDLICKMHLFRLNIGCGSGPEAQRHSAAASRASPGPFGRSVRCSLRCSEQLVCLAKRLCP